MEESHGHRVPGAELDRLWLGEDVDAAGPGDTREAEWPKTVLLTPSRCLGPFDVNIGPLFRYFVGCRQVGWENRPFSCVVGMVRCEALGASPSCSFAWASTALAGLHLSLDCWTERGAEMFRGFCVTSGKRVRDVLVVRTSKEPAVCLCENRVPAWKTFVCGFQHGQSLVKHRGLFNVGPALMQHPHRNSANNHFGPLISHPSPPTKLAIKEDPKTVRLKRIRGSCEAPGSFTCGSLNSASGYSKICR